MEQAKAAWFRTVGYDPHPSQCLFHDSPARFRIPLCGRRYGKSTMAARDREPNLFKPHNRGWIVGPTYDLGEKEFRVFWDDLIIGQELGKDPAVKKAYSVKQGNMYIELPNRARVEVRSSDHPETLVGEGLNWLIMSEAAKHNEDIFPKYLRPALTDKHGEADFPTTPEGQNWLYRLTQLAKQPKHQVYDPAKLIEWLSSYEAWNFPSWLNIKVFPGGRQDPEILAAEATTSKEYFDQEYGAIPTSFVGKIFEQFSEDVHVRPVRFNPAWPSYSAFDWGFTNPFAEIQFQVSPRDEVYVWREYYDVGKTLGQHIAILKSREHPPDYHLDLAFGDSADPEAVMEMSINYVPTTSDPKAKENWREGVDLVASFLKELETGGVIDEYGTPEKRPRFFVDPSCSTFIHEMSNYKKADAPRTGTDAQDKPKKRSDHGVDAIRYGLMHVFKLGASLTVDQLADVNHHLWVPQPAIAIREPSMVAPTDTLGLGDGGTIFNFGDDAYVF